MHSPIASSSSAAASSIPAKSATGEKLKLAFVIESGDQKDFSNHNNDAHDRLVFFREELKDAVVECSLGNLSAGDYAVVIYDAALKPEDRKVVALLERKSIDDALASITDGRYKSQAQRMELSGAPLIYWMLVGQRPSVIADRARLNAMKIHLATSYPHTRVKRLANHREATVGWLRKMLHYLEDDINGGHSGMYIDLPSFKAAMVNGRPPRLETQDECWVEQLTVPRLIGRAAAKSIASHYHSATELMLAYGEVVQRHRAVDTDRPIFTQICADDDDLPVMRRSSIGAVKKAAVVAAPTAKKRSAASKKDDTRSALIVDLDTMVSCNVKSPEGKRVVREADSKRLRETFLRAQDIEILAALPALPKRRGDSAVAKTVASGSGDEHESDSLSE